MKQYNPPKEVRVLILHSNAVIQVNLLKYKHNGIVFVDPSAPKVKIFIPYSNVGSIQEGFEDEK